MRTLQEKYNAIQEGKFSKEHFLAEARMQQPQLITRFNGYDDAVQILKNRGMIQEAVTVKFSELKQGNILQNKFSGEKYTVTAVRDKSADIQKGDDGKETEIASLNNYELVKEEVDTKNLKNVKLKNGKIYRNVRFHLPNDPKSFVTSDGGYMINQDIANVVNANQEIKETIREVTPAQERYRVKPSAKPTQFKQDIAAAKKMIDAGKSEKEVVAKYGQAAFNAVNAQNLGEARLTKNSLTDYRYKPTNEMDKYPYEQILRGIRVELEGLGVHGTPTAEEYSKALVKVSKNLAKDSIFYTNQVAGVNTKVDLHDKMVPFTDKVKVDTFNGMKKAELKEGFKKLIKKVLAESMGDMFGDEERAQRSVNYGQPGENEYEFYSDPENYNEEEDLYEMQGAKEDSYYKNELAEYLDDNGIFGYTKRIHDIMTGPDEAENVDELVRYLEDNQIYGYNRGIEQIYADYPYDQHWMNQPDEDEADDISHPRGYEEDTDAETEEDLFETVSLKDIL
jgi:hypothetical protein